MLNQSCATKYVGLGILIASTIYSFPTRKHSEFESSLNDDQLEQWKSIQLRRWCIFVVALVAGLVVAQKYVKSKQWLRVITTLMVTNVAYLLSPKGAYMKDHVSEEQLKLKKKPPSRVVIYGYSALWLVGIVLYSHNTNKNKN